MELQRTTDNSGHYHVVYLRDVEEELGAEQPSFGFTSQDEEHHHLVEWVESISPVIDELGQVKQEAVPGRFVLSEVKGHTHEIVPLETRDPDKENEKDVIERVRELFKAAVELEADSIEQGNDAEKFYMGDQWEASTKAGLEAENRTVITINEIEPKIDILSGTQRNNRSDITYFPTKDGSVVMADILTSVVKYICDQNNFDNIESEAFEDQAIAGRGAFHVYVDYTDDLRGEIKIDQEDWDGIVCGPHKRKDMGDLEYLCRFRRYSMGKLKQLYPDKAEKITKDYEAAITLSKAMEGVVTQYSDDQYSHGNGGIIADTTPTATTDKAFLDIAKKEYIVIECHERVMSLVPVAINIGDDFIFNMQMMMDEDIQKVKTMPGFKVVRKPTTMIKVNTVAGGVHLWQDQHNYKIMQVIPVYAKKRKNKWWGKVKGLIDPQCEINKRTSQSIDIVNRMSSYGWIWDQDTFANKSEEKIFRETSSKPGFTAIVKNTNKLPIRLDGAKIPSEVLALENQASQKMKEISNINNEMLGISMRQQSLPTTIEFKRQGLVGNEFLFDNLSLAKRQIGRLLLPMIQNVYSADKIKSILEYMKTRADLGDQFNVYKKYKDEEINEAIQKRDLLKYDVVVGESASSPSRRQANFLMFMEMAKGGFQIPPDLLLRMSDLPPKEKEEAISSIQQAQAAAAQTEKDKSNAEIIKSKIAAEAKMATAGQRSQAAQ